jgi:hypothetical protein
MALTVKAELPQPGDDDARCGTTQGCDYQNTPGRCRSNAPFLIISPILGGVSGTANSGFTDQVHELPESRQRISSEIGRF